MKILSKALLTLAFLLQSTIGICADGNGVVGMFSGLHLDAGYLDNFISGKNNSFYYNASYKGDQFASKGTPFKVEDLYVKADPPAPPSPKAIEGDTNIYSVQINRGTAAIKGGIFEAVGRKEIKLPIPLLEKLRGTADFSGTLDGRQINISLGLETPALHPVSILNERYDAGLTNWLIVGVNGETRPSQVSGKDNADYGMVTYRAFIGKGFGWVQSYKVKEFQKEIRSRMSTMPKAISEGLKARASVKTNQKQGKLAPWVDTDIYAMTKRCLGLSKEQFDSLTEESDLVKNPPAACANGQGDITTFVTHYTDDWSLPPDKPTSALWLEDSGWYSFAGNEPVHRFNNIVRATATLWLAPQDNSSYIRVLYENGYNKADPSNKFHYFAAMVGLDF
jgi:hypothetical protein